VQRAGDGTGPRPVLRSVTEVGPGDPLRIRVGDGALGAVVTDLDDDRERVSRA
jgi:hypothetical protein